MSKIFICLIKDYKPIAAFTDREECVSWLESVENKTVWVQVVPNGPQKYKSFPLWTVTEFIENSYNKVY